MTSTSNPAHRYATANDGFDHPPTLQDLREVVGLKRCPVVNSAEDIVSTFAAMAQLKREVLVACALDRRSRLIAWNLVAASAHDAGLRNASGAFASVICASGAGLVLLRNSRKSELRTSTAEFAFIRSTSEAAQLLGFALLDYIVLSSSGWGSLLDRPVVESFASVLNLCPALSAAAKGARKWRCRRCRKANHKQIPIYPPIYGTYTPAHCGHCRTFAWLLPR